MLDNTNLLGVFREWDVAVNRHQETLKVIDAEVTKTDYTL